LSLFSNDKQLKAFTNPPLAGGATGQRSEDMIELLGVGSMHVIKKDKKCWGIML
jgi:hypothetical protein